MEELTLEEAEYKIKKLETSLVVLRANRDWNREKRLRYEENGLSTVSYDNKNTWRYATKEEITEYERLENPFDVSSLNNQKHLVVQVKNEDEWKFVLENSVDKSSRLYIDLVNKHKSCLSNKKEDLCICIKRSTYSDLSWFSSQPEKYNIVSFEDWCNSYLPKLKKEVYLERWLEQTKAMKYYFITYQATNRQGTNSVWNQVINISPMKFIKHIESVEVERGNAYFNFVVLNTCEISEDEFKEFDGHLF